MGIDGSTATTVLARHFFNRNKPGVLFIHVRENVNSTVLLSSAPMVNRLRTTNRLNRVSVSLSKPLYPYNGRNYLRAVVSKATLGGRLDTTSIRRRRNVLTQTNHCLNRTLTVPINLLSVTSMYICNRPGVVGTAFVNTTRRCLSTTASSSFRGRAIVQHYRYKPSVAMRNRTVTIIFRRLTGWGPIAPTAGHTEPDTTRRSVGQCEAT